MTDTVPNASRRPRRDWHLLWTASAVSTIGDGAFLAVLPLLAASMTTDPRLIAGVTAWGTLPWLLAALPAGALADRWDARRTMARFQVAQALLLGALAAATLTAVGGVAVLYAAAFAVGLAETMVKVSAQKLVPAVVGARDLERANGRQNATVFANRMFLGPPLGALLFSLAASLPLWWCASTFAVSAALACRIRTPTTPGHRRTLRVEIGEGVRWLGSNRLLRTLSLLSGVANLANFMAMATFVLFARERLGVSDAAYGVVVALTGVGGVLGSLLSDPDRRRARRPADGHRHDLRHAGGDDRSRAVRPGRPDADPARERHVVLRVAVERGVVVGAAADGAGRAHGPGEQRRPAPGVGHPARRRAARRVRRRMVGAGRAVADRRCGAAARGVARAPPAGFVAGEPTAGRLRSGE